MKFADRFPSALGWAEAAILSTLVRKVIGSICTEPWFSKNWCRIPASCSSHEKHRRGPLRKWMDRNTARCLGSSLVGYRQITQKSPAPVRASAGGNGQEFNEFNKKVKMILHLHRIWSDVWVWIYFNLSLITTMWIHFNHKVITTALSWMSLYTAVLQQS